MIKKIFKGVPPFILVSVSLFLLQMGLLLLCRLAFYVFFKTADSITYGTGPVVQAFTAGISFDLVASSYALFLPAILLVCEAFIQPKTGRIRRFIFMTTVVIFWIFALVSMADFPYYKQFGSHLNKQAFLWAASPGYLLGLIFGDISYYGYLGLFILLAYVEYGLIKTIIYRDNSLGRQAFSVRANLLWLLMLVPAIIYASRGRISTKSTTHEGMAIVSDNQFLNQIALNPNFTFFRAVFFQKIKTYKAPSDIDVSLAFAGEYLESAGPDKRDLVRRIDAGVSFKPYNVVIVCMESMSMYKTGFRGQQELTPKLKAICQESVLFDRFFSSGIHTFNGLFSTAAGFPSMLTEQGLRRYTKKPFLTLANLLLKKNYRTYLAVTHDPVFDNMEGFFKLNGYSQVVSSNDLSQGRSLGATGVPDHELFHALVSTINRGPAEKPFLAFVMTGSDHGPWLIPDDIPFKPDADRKEKRSTQYADWAIGEFMKEAKKQTWYSNTLFVFLGDHGYTVDGTYEMPLSYHHIPFILHKPNTLAPGVNHHLGYQPDVTATVAGVLGLSYTGINFGLDIMTREHPFVYFTADDKIGCVSDDGYYFYELISQKVKRLRRYENLDQKDYYSEKKSKADSLEAAARHMLNAAEYIIRRDYFSY
jgi:phosphoglycerol transferase MdoB-like AlkP superfamily enzyme